MYDLLADLWNISMEKRLSDIKVEHKDSEDELSSLTDSMDGLNLSSDRPDFYRPEGQDESGSTDSLNLNTERVAAAGPGSKGGEETPSPSNASGEPTRKISFAELSESGTGEEGREGPKGSRVRALRESEDITDSSCTDTDADAEDEATSATEDESPESPASRTRGRSYSEPKTLTPRSRRNSDCSPDSTSPLLSGNYAPRRSVQTLLSGRNAERSYSMPPDSFGDEDEEFHSTRPR